MPAYIQGNLALDQKPTQKVKIKETRKVVYRQKTMPVQEKMLYLFTVLLCVIVAGVIVWRYAQIYQLNTDMLKMQREIREIQAENSVLKQEVMKLQSPERLKEEARKWGFLPREEEQVKEVISKKVATNP
jgi:cell division protein FtsL